jgi:phosphoribosylglycinamide formyltransferase-1
MRLVVLISGGGSTLANLVSWIDTGRLCGVRIAGVISSRRAVKGNQIAESAGLPLKIVHPRDFPTDEQYGRAMAEAVDSLGPDYVAMGGFLRLWQFPPQYAGRVLNIHPALLPDFGGIGMFGLRVHEAVLAAKAAYTGCAVHLVDHAYDHGPVVARAKVQIEPGDTPQSLSERVMQSERWLYPWVLGQVASHGTEWLAAASANPHYFESSPFEGSESASASPSG